MSFLFEDEFYDAATSAYGHVGAPVYDTTGTVFTSPSYTQFAAASAQQQFNEWNYAAAPAAHGYQAEFMDQSQFLFKSKPSPSQRLEKAQNIINLVTAIEETIIIHKKTQEESLWTKDGTELADVIDSKRLFAEKEKHARESLLPRSDFQKKGVLSLLTRMVEFFEEESSEAPRDVIVGIATQLLKPSTSNAILKARLDAFINDMGAAIDKKRVRHAYAFTDAVHKLTLGSLRLIRIIFSHYVDEYKKRVASKK